MEKILLAVDGSDTSMKAADKALKLAKVFQAQVVILSVVYEQPIYPMPGAVIPPDLPETRKTILNTIVEATKEMVEFLKEKYMAEEVEVSGKVVIGRPSDEIIKEAEEGNYDLIILGSRGLTGVKKMLLGTVSGKVANNSKQSVLIIK